MESGLLRRWRGSFVLAVILISGCGGGGGSPAGGAPAPPPAPATYTVGGTAAGLDGTVVLQNNGGANLPLTSNGAFAFGGALTTGAAYSVTVLTQPASQACEVVNGSGTVGSANVTNVAVTCVSRLAVTVTTPLEGASDVARSIAPAVTFSAAPDPATVTSANVILRHAGGVVATAPSVTGTQVTLQPGARLLPLTDYTLTVNTGVRGAGGETLAADVVRQFRTRDAGWGDAALLEQREGDAGQPSIAADGGGNAFAAWSQMSGTRSDMYAARYTSGSGWNTPELIETNNSGSASLPHIAASSNGSAVAVWLHFDGARFAVWANRHAPGAGWGIAEPIEANGPGDARAARVALDGQGNAIAVWQQYAGTRSNIWANRYVPGSGWGTAVLIETSDRDGFNPEIAVHAGGDAVVVWHQSGGGQYDIWANRYVAGTGWSSAQLLETDDRADAQFPDVAVDSAGNAIAVWQQSDGARHSIWASRLGTGGTWSVPALLEDQDLGPAERPRIAFDGSGNAIAVWHQVEGSLTSIWANRYVAGTGWASATLIESDIAGSAQFPQIAVDSAGNAVAVWEHAQGARVNIWANRYRAGSGWADATMIEISNSGDAFAPQVAITTDGAALAIWEHGDGTRYDIAGNRYD